MADGGASAGRRSRLAPNLTPDKTGLADWSQADIVDALADGTLPQGLGTLGEEMGEVVRNSTSRLRAGGPCSDRRLSQSAAAAADAGEEENEMTRRRAMVRPLQSLLAGKC